MAGHPPSRPGPGPQPVPFWARQRHLCGPLTIPHRPHAEPLPGLPGDQRCHHLRTCLTGGTALPLATRVAAAITLLYGAPLTHVLQMRTTDTLTVSGRSHLRLGEHPVLLPPAIAGLIRRQAAEASSRPAAPDGSHWRAGPRPRQVPYDVINGPAAAELKIRRRTYHLVSAPHGNGRYAKESYMKFRTARILLPSAFAVIAALAPTVTASASVAPPPVTATAGIGQPISSPRCSGDVCLQIYQPANAPNLGVIDVRVWAQSFLISGHFELQVPNGSGGSTVLNSPEITDVASGTGYVFQNVLNNDGQFTAHAWQDDGLPGSPFWVSLGTVGFAGAYI